MVKMTLDTEIEDWESVGNIEYAISAPDQEKMDKGNIYIRGEVDDLKEFFFAFVHKKCRDRGAFEEEYGKYFDALEQAEAEKRPLGESEINVSNERFYLRCKFDYDGTEIRSNSVLDYFNRFSPWNFEDMKDKFNRTLELYTKLNTM